VDDVALVAVVDSPDYLGEYLPCDGLRELADADHTFKEFTPLSSSMMRKKHFESS